MKEFTETIKTVSGAAEKFALYENMLLEWNQKFNLTAITEHGDIEVKHFYDSVTAQKFLSEGASVLDIGSGAGFPGIPLKIVRDDIKIRLIDSVNKKVVFMNEVIKALGLKNAEARHVRAEDMDKNEKFDAVVTRAVAALSTICEYALPFLKKGGIMIAYKSEKAEEEIINARNALETLGGEIKTVSDESVSDYVRKLIVIEKIRETPPLYPRGKNLPRTKPL